MAAEFTGGGTVGQLQILSYWVSSSRLGGNGKTTDGAFNGGNGGGGSESVSKRNIIRWGLKTPETKPTKLEQSNGGEGILLTFSNGNGLSPSVPSPSSVSEGEEGSSGSGNVQPGKQEDDDNHKGKESLIQSQHYGGLHQQHSGVKQKSTGCQAKETTNSPVAHFAVYQPAGPLIEPHKTSSSSSSSSIHLPESVRLPPDLKVTYQTHPPPGVISGSTTTSSSSSPVPGSGKSSSSYTTTSGVGSIKQQSTGTSKGSHRAQSTSSKQQSILHQPYKSSSSVSSTSTTSTTATSTSSRTVQNSQSVIQQQQQVSSGQQTVNFSVFGGTTATLMAPGASQTVASGGVTMTGHLPLSAAAASVPGAPGAMYYPGFPHQSPFAPCKYPIVPPDSYRAHSPYPNSYLYSPATPQPSPQNFYMTPFYTPPMTPTTTPVLGPRPMIPSHHSTAAAAYYQVAGGPVPSSLPVPSGQHPSNYFIPSAAQLQPSHHSIPSQPPPNPGGLGGLSLHPACPCPLDRSNNNINNKSCNTTNSKQQQQQQSIGIPDSNLQNINNTHRKSPNVPATANRRKDNSHPPCPTPASTVVMNQAKQLESAKTSFTEQYSLPDDITITPIIVVPGDQTGTDVTSSSTVLPVSTQSVRGNNNKNHNHQPSKPVQQKQRDRDIIHVIDPRSGRQTTNLNAYLANQNKNVSSVKPNNVAGKLNPVLDVILLAPGHRPADSLQLNNNNNSPQQQHVVSQGKRQQRQSLLTTNKSNNIINNNNSSNNNNNNSNNNNYKNQRTELVQPLQVPPIIQNNNNNTLRKRGENPRQGMKRKGILECIDGLQKKKMRLLEEENSTGANKILLNGSDAQLAVSALAPTTQRNNNTPPTMKKSVPSVARAMPREEIFEMRNSTIVNEREAMLAASAVVNLPNGSHVRLSPHKNGLRRGRTWHTELQGISTGHNKVRGDDPKITTRSSAANAKIKTRSSVKDGVYPVYFPVAAQSSQQQQQQQGGRMMVQPEMQRNRSRLLRKRINHSGNSTVRLVHNNSNIGSGNPYTLGHHHHQQLGRFNKSRSPGSGLSSPGSSGSGSNSSQVILRIPKVPSTSSPGHMSLDHHHHRSSLLTTSSMMMMSPMTVDSCNYGHAIEGNIVVGEASGRYKAQIPGTMALTSMSALKKRAIVKPLTPNIMNGALNSMLMSRRQPKWSNGWRFEGEPFEAKVYLQSDDQSVIRRCYPAMRHDGGDVIQARDCVLLKSGPRKTDLPFVAKVAALWENPVDGEMMFSLLWYYRPEHTEIGRTREDMSDEIFASKHRDCNSVATIEDRCYVLTLNEYCRYKKRLKQLEEGISIAPIVPLASSQTNVNLAANIALAVWCGIQGSDQTRRVPAPGKVSPEVVYFCRKVYDYRQKKMVKNPS